MGTVVVTGTSSGIGLATALHFAGGGHRVFATMRDVQRAGPLVAAAEDAGVSVEVRPLDVDDADSVTAAIDGIARDAGRIDVLVNNAGVISMRPWEHESVADMERLFRTNFFGAVRCAQAVIPMMREQGSGAIVNVASIAGVVAAPVQGPYCASKAALLAFTESLAVELRQYGVRVVAVSPGFFATPMLAKGWEGYQPDATNPYADLMGRWSALYAGAGEQAGDPRDVARAIEQAIADDATISRLVGADAACFASGRSRMGDAGWLCYGDRQRDEEWWGRFNADFPAAPADAPA
jgi:NAD(P)-dependent dehydrogenase (short-subunit alcohol dehydrogenase family)